MELVYIKYLPKNKNIILLEMGTRGNKICGLLSEKVTDHERAKIIKAKSTLTAMGLTRIIQWLRDHCPNAYRNAYREVLNSNIEIISRHQIK